MTLFDFEVLHGVGSICVRSRMERWELVVPASGVVVFFLFVSMSVARHEHNGI